MRLNLKGDWYFDIGHGDKREEYREVKPFYDRILDEYGYVKIKGVEYHATEILVCFSNGYATDRPQMYWTLKNLAISQGKEKWGVVNGVEYYRLYLDEDVTDKVRLHSPLEDEEKHYEKPANHFTGFSIHITLISTILLKSLTIQSLKIT